MKPSPHDDASDDTERAVRHSLRAAAADFTPPPWPGEAVRARAGRHRRTRRLAQVLPLAAAVTVAALLTAGQLRDRAASGPSGPTAGHSTPAPAGPAVEVVPPNRSLDIGAGLHLRLAPTKLCFSSGAGAWQCKPVATDTGGDPWINPDVRATPDATVYVPVFHGPHSPARMLLTLQGHDYPLRMATLPGSPGYTAGYVAAPPPPASGSLPAETVTAYDRQGSVLATVTVPASG